MQRNSIIILFIALFFFIACSSSHSSADSDSVSDADRDTQDPPTVVDEDADKDVDLVEDSDRTPDADQDADHDKNEDKDQTVFPDTDSSPDADQVPVNDADEDIACLDLRYNENTIKTPFPFKDANGKPTFCRPGCDTPTENDPQCVRNIWEWDNWDEYQVYLEAQGKNPNQTKERECYPWPCKLPNMHAKTKETLNTFISSCDRLLTVNDFKASSLTVWTHGMYDDVAGMDFSHSGRIVEYDPEKDEYTTVGQNKTSLAFNENRYVTLIHDSDPPNNANFKSFLISVFRKNGEYYYELIHDNKNHNTFLSRPALAGKNWVLIHAREGKQSSTTAIKYASSQDWVWHELSGINNYAGEGNIVGDHLTFITNNRELYYCDLREYPKHLDECFKLNRKDGSGTEDLGHSPRIDLDDEYRVVYNVYGTPKFVEVDFKDQRNPKYTEYTIEKNKETAWTWQPSMLRGNTIAYMETFTMSNGEPDSIGCFYRFDKQKTYCPKEHTFSTDPSDLMGFNAFWGKWHLWKRTTRPTAVIRDLECYCKETGICPLEPATEEELNRKPPLGPQAQKTTTEILTKIEQEKVLPEFDGNGVLFCTITERDLGQFGNHGYCPTAAQMNKYLKLKDKSDSQLKDLILSSKRHWKTEKSFANLLANHEKIWDDWYGCQFHKEHFECEYDEMTSTFDSDSVMFATVIDHGRARDGIFFRDRFYEANGNFAKVIKELRQKFGASLRGMPRIEVKENKDGGVR